ncbi:hypothetical protein [Cupriavidus sp. H19C3]|uniref:hypothetical protein n=1 Tax=Cupriavidus sp. H19C3 TaxID=3241603 RepID=UPI003BF8C246
MKQFEVVVNAKVVMKVDAKTSDEAKSQVMKQAEEGRLEYSQVLQAEVEKADDYVWLFN